MLTMHVRVSSMDTFSLYQCGEISVVISLIFLLFLNQIGSRLPKAEYLPFVKIHES